MEPLRDSWDREIKSVRVSVTDGAIPLHLLHAGGGPRRGSAAQEMLQLRGDRAPRRVLARLGVDEVRLTGGEPLVRRDLPTLVGDARADRGVRDLSLTTNGVLLDRYARAAGRGRPTAPERLARLARRTCASPRSRGATRWTQSSRPRGGERYPELRPIKVNCVAVKRGFTETEVPALAELARRQAVHRALHRVHAARRRRGWREDDVLTGAEIRAIIEERARPARVELPAKASSTARRFRFADGAGEIGFVNPVSEPFCSSCDRIRLTADGQLRTCLFSRREWDLKAPLRERRKRRRARGELLRSAPCDRTRSCKHRRSTTSAGFRARMPVDVARSADKRPTCAADFSTSVRDV